MGYYTNYKIELIRGNRKEFSSLLNRLAEISQYPELKDGYADSIRWYCWLENSIEVSKEFPNILFMIEGDGEDSDDIWRCYFKNGDGKQIFMVWPEINLDDLC